MKNLLFLLMLSVGFMSFSSSAEVSSCLDVLPDPCTNCTEGCCTILIHNGNGHTRTINACCELIQVVRQ